MKKQFTAEERKNVSDYLKTIAQKPIEEAKKFIALTIGDFYDDELPIPEVIDSIAKFVRASNRPDDNHVYYLSPGTIDKKVLTLDSTCTITEQKVTPNTRTELTLGELISPEYWVCFADFISGDVDVLQAYADSIMESMDRKEIQLIIALLDAAAIANSKTFTDDSGDTGITFDKFVEMLMSVNKYGTKYVLIAGANVWSDLILLDKNQNTFRDYGFEKIRSMVTTINLNTYTVDTNGSGQTDVIDADVAYLVATSDSRNNRPLLVARRSLTIAGDMADTTIVNKDRMIVEGGNRLPITGGTIRLGRSVLGYEQFGAVMLNSKVVAKYTKS